MAQNRRVPVTPLLALVLVLGFTSSTFADPPPIANLTGTWLGYFQSSLTREAGSFYLAIPQQDHRRFSGRLFVPHNLEMPPTLIIPFDGTLAATNRFNVVGKGNMGMFVVNGDVYSLGDGSAWATFDYRLKTTATDEGFSWMIKSFRSERAPVLGHDFIGEFVSDDGSQKGPVFVMIRAQKGSDFAGQATVGNMNFPFLGSVADMTKDGSSLHALGATPNLWFRIDGMLDPDGETIHATFTAIFADGSVLRGSFMLRCNETPEPK